jgi:hypothetical protein
LKAADEDIPPFNESDVILDWLDSIGGQALVDHCSRVYANVLEKVTVHDIHQRLIDSIIEIQLGG